VPPEPRLLELEELARDDDAGAVDRRPSLNDRRTIVVESRPRHGRTVGRQIVVR
jgi:hypothetical protein